MVEVHAYAGRDEQAMRFAQQAIKMCSTSHNTFLKSKLGIDVSVRLMYTKFWRQAANLIPQEDVLNDLDMYHRDLAGHATAVSALRRGDIAKAARLSAASSMEGRWPLLEARGALVAAQAALAGGRKGTATESAGVALDAAEHLSSAPLLAHALNVAKGILGGRKIESAAAELAHILAA
jgi:hypothetical protein